MRLEEAFAISDKAIIVLREDREFILATQDGSYHNFTYVPTRNFVYTYPLDQRRFEEVHVFADHQYIDTRAPESILWFPLERDMNTVPEWGKAELTNVLGWQ